MNGITQVTGMRNSLTEDRHREILDQLVPTLTVNLPSCARDAVDTVVTFYQAPMDREIVDLGEGSASLVVCLPGRDQSRPVSPVRHSYPGSVLPR
ncbi:hypothetical protein [Celeribacter halophilus]|uniref:hypothetical protein n=1 Tax=Celeribacter halophilus TaxID=576117 RepID=UPI003A90A905